MPVLVAEALVYVWPAIVAAIGTTGVTVLSYAIVVGAFYAYGTYQARKARNAARDQFNASLTDRLVMTTTVDAPRSRLYGRVRNVDGVLYKATHGTNKEFYTFVVAIAGHEVDGFEHYWFADQEVTLDGGGMVQEDPYRQQRYDTAYETTVTTGSSGTFVLAHQPVGTVSAFHNDGTSVDPPTQAGTSYVGTTLTYTGATPGIAINFSYQYVSGTSYARVRAYTGAAGQDLSGDLIALGITGITSAHKFQGIACLLVTLQFNTDAFPQGVPGFSATVRGAKVFDPRTSTTAWSENVALCTRDWALYPYGGNCDVSEIVESTFITAANACDVTHLFHTVSHGDTLKPMFTCGVVAPTQTDPTATMNELVSAMAGKFAWVGGQLRVKAGAYIAPVIDIDESWLSGQGSIEIVSGIARIDLVNVYRPTIADSEKNFVMTPIEPVKADAYITLDGEELARDVTFLAITDSYHAQHVSGVLLRDARQGLTVKLPCNMKAYPVEVFDTVTLTLAQWGWAAKEFEVLTWEFSETGGVQLALKETAASIFDPDATFTLSDAAPNTNLPLPWYVPAPTGVHASSGTIPLDDGSIVTRTLIEWNASTSEYVLQSGSHEVQVANIYDGIWQSIYAEGKDTQVIVSSLLGNIPYLIRVRAISSYPLAVKSDWSTQISHVVARPAAAIADWTDIPGRPKSFRVVSRGQLDVGGPVLAGIYDGETGAGIDVAPAGGSRSYTIYVIRRSDGVIIAANLYDVYIGTGATPLAAQLNALGNDVIAVVLGEHEPQTNRLTSGLFEAMLRCGASRAVFGSPQFKFRASYILIGIPGSGEGNGYESYQGVIDNDTSAWCDVAFTLLGGNFVVGGTGATPRSLQDYSYTGTLDATTDLSLVARGNCVVAGNLASKLGGAIAWDSDVYSRDSATFACFMSFVVVDLNHHLMGGLNSDPTTDQSYSSLDFAWYVVGGTHDLAIYESGVAKLSGLAGSPGDVLLVLYDGSNMRYLQNGVVRRTVAVAAALTFFMDSSFYDPNGSMHNIRFGALSANDWSSIGGVNVTTSQIAASAATDVYQDNFDFAGGTFGTTTARTFSVTPTVNCIVELTATIGGIRINGDSGSSIKWNVSAGGGAPVLLGQSNSGSSLTQTFSISNSFAATAGVPLSFTIDINKGGFTNVALFASTMRVTLIKR